MTASQAHPSPAPPLFGRLRLWHKLLIAFFGVLTIGVMAFVIFQPIKVLPRMRLAPGFALIDQQGQRLTNEDLRGQFVLYNFTYTGCQAPACPQYDQIMAAVQQQLAAADAWRAGETPISLVTISFDPERDDQAALAAYAQSLGADTAHWRFLSGDPVRLKSIIGSGFEVYYQQEADGAFTFSPTMVLVDGWGIVRAVYNTRTSPPDAPRILRHFNVLAEEVRNSKGIGRLGYEAAHLFLCYES